MKPIQEFVPQHPPMLLLDAVVEVSETLCRTSLRVNPAAWYANADGTMPAWLGLELMAQTAAAHSGWKNRDAASPKCGYLLGTRRYQSTLAHFPADSTLVIQAELDYAGVFGQSAFLCQISLNETTVAEATLKVLETA
ncbi:MAG: hypothetical protein Q8O00_09340 [Holophaga sp.]|nr:hypothetical protein [Holophaga sp.]